MRLRLLLLVAVVAALAAAVVWKTVGLPGTRRRDDRVAPPRKLVSARAARPNVVLISLDTLRPDHLGCYGYPKPTSPNLDRFAATAARFTNVRSQAPWTLPSHMSLLTSTLPSHNGVYNFASVLPAEVPTLAQVLKAQGYRTAGLVNDGQMKARWGFDRGFDLWREFPALTAEGSCVNLTDQALAWLASSPPAPYFLFLHYYDIHHPYGTAAPPRFRESMGSDLGPEESERVIMEHHVPGKDFPDPALMTRVVGAYDGGISWVDHELGRLLAAIPPDAMVVVFSDHGEAFKEHGWTVHGATLYEEETRVVLLLRPPTDAGGKREGSGSVVDQPAALLDVSPTILGYCGTPPPPHYEGLDLAPALRGRTLPSRLLPSETRAFLEGRLLNALTLYPFKLIYSLHDGAYELYKLPDEHRNLSASDPQAAAAMLAPMKAWLGEENYWLLYVKGRGTFDARIRAVRGRLATAIPVNFGFETGDKVEFAPDYEAVRWHALDPAETKLLYVCMAPPDAPLEIDFAIDGQRRADRVFAGASGDPAPELPIALDPLHESQSPVIERPFAPPGEGLYIMRHRAAGGGSDRPEAVSEPLDEKTLRQLRSLGYLQ